MQNKNRASYTNFLYLWIDARPIPTTKIFEKKKVSEDQQGVAQSTPNYNGTNTTSSNLLVPAQPEH